MSEAKFVVTREYPRAYCVQNDSTNRCFVVLSHPHYAAKVPVKIIGRGRTALTAWQDAARYVDAALAETRGAKPNEKASNG